jgi:hypothetical protein
MFYLTVTMTVINVIVGVSNYWSNRDKVTKARFEAQNKELADIKTKLAAIPTTGCNSHSHTTMRLDGHSDRLRQHKELIDTLIAEVKHLPKAEDLGKIHVRIDSLLGATKNIEGEFKVLSRNLELILEHHIKER